jgi:putative pyruvate formate lyase activating enzyme
MANMEKNPLYLSLHKTGQLAGRASAAKELAAACTLCPHCCGVNRLAGETGMCGVGSMAGVASFGPHFGEEQLLVGTGGSGAIFFTGCNLGCVFCQNAEISHLDNPDDTVSQTVNANQLAAIMLELQELGCLNINLVTPSHIVPQILEALVLAAEQGLHLPLVYNSSGYDSVQTLQLLDGVVDIYMPDCKFITPWKANRYTNASDYPEVMQKAVWEMHRQVGELVLDKNGIGLRGLLVRHLVMPGGVEDTAKIIHFLAAEISKDTYVNIMDQYHPCFRAAEFDEINRPVTKDEYEHALEQARLEGLHRLAKKDIGAMLQLILENRVPH